MMLLSHISTVPVQSPYSPRTVPVTVPVGIYHSPRGFRIEKGKVLTLSSSSIRKTTGTVVNSNGDCHGDCTGTVRGLYGDCRNLGNVLCEHVSMNLSMGWSAQGKSKETRLLLRRSAVHIQFLLLFTQDDLVDGWDGWRQLQRKLKELNGNAHKRATWNESWLSEAL